MLGLIGKKIGMTQVFDEKGKLTPVTVIKIESNVVVAQRTMELNGYNAAVLGSGQLKNGKASKPYAGQFRDGNALKTLVEFRDYDREVHVGDVLGADIFNDVSFVDITGTSKGKGFQGAMKRYGFGGGRATHGSKFHRDLGGTAMSSTPSRTFPGKKMAGHMGNERVTVQNLRIVRVDENLQVLMVRGAVPGPSSSTVVIRKAVKK